MARYTFYRKDHNEIGFWLVFSRGGDVRMTRGEPSMASNERGMAVIAKIPHNLFSTPQLRAEIAVADPGPSSVKIDVDAVAAALTQSFDGVLDITVRQEKNDD